MAEKGVPSRKRLSRFSAANTLDFTSALYLGFYHAHYHLPAWNHLTTGVPAALRESQTSRIVAKKVADLIGCESGLAFSSTLHLFRDLFDYLSRRRIVIFLDAGAYPITEWGAEWASRKGTPVLRFPHGDSAGLKALLTRRKWKGARPVVISDGWCSACGQAMPLAEYLAYLRPFGGWLILDDTQAMGVLGRRPSTQLPYGLGGGGILPWLNIQSNRIIACSSLAKAFGAPIAVLAGPEEIIHSLRNRGLTRLHSSPPSQAHVTAARRALQVNELRGDRLRAKLWRSVRYLSDHLARADLRLRGGIFPIQHITGFSGPKVFNIRQVLSKKGIEVLLTAGHAAHPYMTLNVRADQEMAEIEQTAEIITSTIRKYT